MPDANSQATVDLVLRPHRSLSHAGFWALMGLLSAISFIAGLAFWWAGAWPVIGFFGLDVLLVYVAFRASYAAARAYERLRLFPHSLTVERVHATGRREEFDLQPYWLRVELIGEPGYESRLRLLSHG